MVSSMLGLGYDRQLPERYRGIVRIEAILMRPDTPFFARLNHAFARIAATLDRSVLLHRTFLDERDPLEIARHIANPGFRRSGLIIAAPDHPEVRARLREAMAAGVIVVQIVSRIGDADDPFIGINNYAAGRTAAFYMTNMLQSRSGTLVALCHSGAYHGHKERIRGFSDYLSEHPNPAHVFTLVMFGLDDRRR
jgi:LacI family transcriptional regulator